MINAIIYMSNAGTTAQYAELIGKITGLPVYPLNKSDKIARGSEIIYLGWLMAGIVKGYKKAAKHFKICAVCGIGMGETGSQLADVKKANLIPDELPVFTMRGGFDITKLHGIYKLMMNMMKNTEGKKLSEKKDRTPDEDIMLDMLMNGGNYVSEENASEILKWYENSAKGGIQNEKL